MPWNDSTLQEYMDMLNGPIGEALDLSYFTDINSQSAKYILINFLVELENGNYEKLKIEPESQYSLTYAEMRALHLMRVACCMHAERLGFFPWKLKEKSVSELRPLLSIHYQGLRKNNNDSKYYFHHIWDVNPGQRMMDSILQYSFMIVLVIIGYIDKLPATEKDMIYYLIKNMRDEGWYHYSDGNYDSYPNHGDWCYDYEILREVKRGTCHIGSSYLVSMLRSYNIPAHIGKGWGDGVPPSDHDEYINLIHKYGHCYIHFSAIKKWFTYGGDDVYDALIRNIPVEYSFKSHQWMSDYFFDSSQYEIIREDKRYKIIYWIIFIGESQTILTADVKYLYFNGLLRNFLETLHLEDYWTTFDGAPEVIPPFFSDYEVDIMMNWVEKRITA